MARKVIALLRVSTEAQAGPDRQGLPAQRRACERIAEIHSLEIAEWVELEGVSGASVIADKRFTRFLQRLQDPAIHGVIVAEFIATEYGLGYELTRYHVEIAIPQMYAVIIIVGVIGLALFLAVEWIDKRVVFWRPEDVERSKLH